MKMSEHNLSPVRFPIREARSRASFTLVEMLVVVTIIGILAALITGAAIAAMRHARVAAIVLDIGQLDMACKNFKERFGEYPPDGIDPAATTRFLRKAFPRYTGGCAAFDPTTALNFWLAGPSGNGFSANPANPFDGSASRIGPFFDFDQSRLNANKYWPTGAAGDKTAGAIIYFRAENGNYTRDGTPTGTNKSFASGGTVYPAKDAGGGWINPASFQIFSSGMDVKYGNFSDSWKFPVGPYKDEDFDDITNFSGGTLENAMP